MSAPSVLFAIPTHSDFVHADTLGSLFETQRLLAAAGVACELAVRSGSVLPMVRNRLVEDALREPFTHVLCLDADIGWDAPDVLRLLAHGKDVVGGIYENRNGQMHCLAHPRGARDAPGLLEVDALGAGFLMVSRNALERLTAAWGPHRVFEFVHTADHVTGEDYVFCARWRGLGGKVYADPVPRLRHHGQRMLSMTWSEAHRAGRPRAAAPIAPMVPHGTAGEAAAA